MKRTLALFAASAMLTFSCSDDDPVAPSIESANYMPMAQGNYWVYHGVDTDLDGTEISDTDVEDSVAVGAAWSHGDYSGNVLVTYRDGQEVSSDPYAVDEENGILFTYIDLFPLAEIIDTNEFRIDSRWVKVADANNDSWTVLDTTIADIQFTVPDVPLVDTANITVEGNLKATGERIGTQSVVIDGETHEAIQFRLTQSLDLTLYVAELGGDPNVPGSGIPVDEAITFDVVVVDGIGVYSTNRGPIDISINLGIGEPLPLLQLNGYKQTLLRLGLIVE